MKKNTIEYRGRTYTVTDEPRIYADGRELPQNRVNAYMAVSHYSRDKGRNETVYVHRLVAMAFHGLPEGKSEGELQVDHIDNDGTNNRPDNLRWVTRAFNNSRPHARRMKRKHHRCTDRSGQYLECETGGRLRTFRTLDEAAEALGCTRQNLIHHEARNRARLRSRYRLIWATEYAGRLRGFLSRPRTTGEVLSFLKGGSGR